MASVLCPYLSFTDNAREAMSFYRDVFGGELTISTFGEAGMGEGPIADRVMHSHLATPAGFNLMGSDTPPGMERPGGSAITVMVSGDDDEALRGHFAALAEGGRVSMPLERQFWGDVFGMVTDRFGVAWGVDIAAAGDVA